VVASTSQTLVTFRSGLLAWGTRVQIMPVALATSIAAARAITGPSSSLSISTGLRIGLSFHLTWGAGSRRGLPEGVRSERECGI
jgi:hypothetical protein